MEADLRQKTETGHVEFSTDQFRELQNQIEKYKGKTGAAIRVMSKSQEIFGYLPRKVLLKIAVGLGVPPVDIYGIATFYSFFSTIPPARHRITTCQGTACYVRGGQRVLEEMESTLHIHRGETTPDREFSIHPVRCIGACALAPVIKIDAEVYGRLSPRKAGKILKRYAKNQGGTADGKIDD